MAPVGDGLWGAIRHPLETIERKIDEAQTCQGCDCKPGQRRGTCDCLRQYCRCAGAEDDDNPEWERDPGPDALIPDAGGRHDLPPAAESYKPPWTTGDHGVHTRWRVDHVRWLGPGRTDAPTDRRPSQAATTSSAPPLSGGTMSVGAARAEILAGHEVGTEVLGGLTQQLDSLEQVQAGLRHAAEESNQAEAEQANGKFADAVSKIGEAQQQLASALQDYETVAQRL